MKENKIITDIEQLTPEWLTSLYENNGFLNQGKVIEIISKNPLGGYSKTYSLELKFSDDAQGEDISSSIVIKSNPSRLSEAKFYYFVAKTMKTIPIPICYDAAFSENSGWSHVILNNFSETHAKHPEYPPSKRDFEKAIESLAEIHAFWWDNKNLKELTKHSIPCYPMINNFFRYEENLKWINERKERFLVHIEEKISNNRRKLLETVFSLYPQVASERFKKGKITLIHNDAHVQNFSFPKDSENQKSKAILFDWDFWGSGVGCQDLVSMIGFWHYPDYRHLIEKDLIKHYHNVLLKYGVKTYSWDECWYDYKLSALLNLYRIILRWNSNMKNWWYEFERVLLMIEDLNCMELLE